MRPVVGGRVAPLDRQLVLECLETVLGAAPEPLRVVVREIQGLGGPIDAVACDADGTPVIVGIATPEQELDQLGHLLAQRAWLRPRIRDWLQLNPQLPFREDRPPRLLLLGALLAPATLAAAADLGDVELARLHALETSEGTLVALEPVGPPRTEGPSPPRERPVEPTNESRGRSIFRTGLHPDDLTGPKRPRSAPRGR